MESYPYVDQHPYYVDLNYLVMDVVNKTIINFINHHHPLSMASIHPFIIDYR